MTLLEPGPAHPNPLLTPAGIAERYRVDAGRVADWVDAGLPCAADGRIDPFATADWLSWGELARCPALAARWRRYLAWFRPFVDGSDRPRRLRWLRIHRLFLPGPVARLEWHLPALADVAHQRPTAGSGFAARVDRHGRHVLVLADADPLPIASAAIDVALRPRPAPADADRRLFERLVEGVAADFRYRYRHHQPGEGIGGGARLDGSCLDCALLLGARLADRGRPWRLRCGVVAHSAIANPHFWVEAETTGGRWLPLDPSLPAIARMLGADWRAFASAYSGGSDARRVEFAAGPPVADVPGGSTVDSLIGEVVATTADGRRWNAWPCLDWVCGDCSADFTAR